MISVTALLVAPLFLYTLMQGALGDAPFDGFTHGRGTFYGGLSDKWSIHYGSCEYYYLDPSQCTGWDIAAMSDTDPDFGSYCGRCYEVFCDPTSFNDNYGEHIQRESACYDPSASIVVQITDSCPCNYPDNAVSNKRWCCGDMRHFDMSQWAFEKLADLKNGVIGIKYRPVSCDYKPAKVATNSNPSPGFPYPGNFTGDKRSCGGAHPLANDAANTNLYADGYNGGGSSTQSSASSSASQSSAEASSQSSSTASGQSSSSSAASTAQASSGSEGQQSTSSSSSSSSSSSTQPSGASSESSTSQSSGTSSSQSTSASSSGEQQQQQQPQQQAQDQAQPPQQSQQQQQQQQQPQQSQNQDQQQSQSQPPPPQQQSQTQASSQADASSSSSTQSTSTDTSAIVNAVTQALGIPTSNANVVVVNGG